MASFSVSRIFPKLYRFTLVRYTSTMDAAFTKARLLLNFITVTSILSVCFFLLCQVVAINVPAYLFLVTPFILAGIGLLLRTAIPFATVATLLIAVYWVAFTLGVCFSGGIQSLVLPWLTLLPFIANIVINYQHAVRWFAVVIGTIVLFAVTSTTLPTLQYTEGPWRALISFTGLAGLLFFFTSFYHRTHQRFFSLMQERNHLLGEQQDKLQIQNEELKEQQDIIEGQRQRITAINSQLVEKLKEIGRINEVLEEQREVLMHLTKCKWIKEGELRGALKEVALLAAKAMGITQVTVWKMSATQDRLESVMSYNSLTSEFTSGVSFDIAGYQLYYEVLYAEKIVAVEDVLTHELTKQNSNDYFIPHNIKSCMDVPYYMGGTLGGTISFENHASTRTWTNQDKNFAQALADIVTLAVESAWRREYEEKIRLQNESISQINKSLEDRVRKRTEELEKQNEKLAEYAFINSHVLRAPLSRILGLIHLVDISEKKDGQLIAYLRQSGNELDEVVKKINRALDERGELARKDFK
jgi:GAF domain-containing protein